MSLEPQQHPVHCLACSGYPNFVDQQAEHAATWWTEAIRDYSKIVDFSGISLDMTELLSFVIDNAEGPEGRSISWTRRRTRRR